MCAEYVSIQAPKLELISSLKVVPGNCPKVTFQHFQTQKMLKEVVEKKSNTK